MKLQLSCFIAALASIVFTVQGEALNDNTDQSTKTSTDKINAIPDLMQSAPAAALPLEGLTYCGPVAVSNSMVYLAHHGYPKLGLLGGSDTPERQGRLTRKLGSLMSAANGTSPRALTKGIASFVTSCDYTIQSLKYQGWEDTPEPYSTHILKPDINWIKAGFAENSAVWLMIGWYNYAAKKDEYASFAQHWVTLVGFGQDKTGKPDPNILIIHDPAPRSGAALSNDYVRLERISHGTLLDRKDKQASGWYKMSGDLKLKQGADFGILDGAVVLKLAKAINN